MKGMDDILENVLINAWAGAWDRSPDQVNRTHEADAELLQLPGMPEKLLAVTVDTIAEEITAGLYRDPVTIGWITVMAALSDLAAVGAEALGLVVSVSLEAECEAAFSEGLAKGMAKASSTSGVFILGGDTNQAPQLSTTGCAFGLVPRDRIITRLGCRPGDAVFISGRAGAGNALALVRLAAMPDELFPESRYRPLARLAEGRLIREFASCSMDTSDGLLTTLDQLMRLNGMGFSVELPWDAVIAPSVLDLCRKTDTPPWLMAAGFHGEFELVFTVPEERAGSFEESAGGIGFKPLRLGTVRRRPALTLAIPGRDPVDIDMAPLRNALGGPPVDGARMIRHFLDWGARWGMG